MTGKRATATLHTCDGRSIELPALRAWEIVRTDGESCDAISLRTARSLDAATLQRADRISVRLGGELVFSGLVDEIELSLSDAGTELSIFGRGYGARLTDNQVPAQTYLRMTTAELVRRYVAPYGINAVTAQTAVLPGYFSVACGNTAMQVVKGFCAHAKLLPPQFDAQGQLLLRSRRQDSGVRFDQSAVFSAVYRDKRHGVISSQRLTHVRTGTVLSASYPALTARGGRCERYGQYSGVTTPASWRNAEQRVEDSRSEEYTVELTVADQFPCQPGTTAQVTLPAFGISGEFCVRQVRSVGSASGCYAEVTLFKGGK